MVAKPFSKTDRKIITLYDFFFHTILITILFIVIPKAQKHGTAMG